MGKTVKVSAGCTPGGMVRYVSPAGFTPGVMVSYVSPAYGGSQNEHPNVG